MSNQSKEILQLISSVLLRCWIIGFVLLGVGLAVTLVAHGLIIQLHGSMFGLSPHELDVIFYCALGLIKLAILVGFFIPWLSLKWVIPKETA